AITNDTLKRGGELWCFSQPDNVTISSKTAVQLPSTSPVVSVQVIPKHSVAQVRDGDHDVIVIHEDWKVARYSGGKLNLIWDQKVSSGEDQDSKVVRAEQFNLKDVKNGFLKDREDILARLDIFD